MYIQRDVFLNRIIKQKDNHLIKTITGVRRCGKSVLLFEIYYNYLLLHGVKDENIIRINLENLDNIKLRDKMELYKYIQSRVIKNQHYYIFIDEIQYVKEFEELLNTLNNNGHDVYVTGSNSKLLSSDIATSLRGRSIEIRLFPLSFKEYYEYVGGDKYVVYNNYLMYGGYPYVVNEEDKDNKISYLKMIEETVASKDIIDRYNIKNVLLFNAVYDFLCSNIGSIISTKKITDTLKSNGFSNATVDTVSNYLQYLCDAYLFYKVYRYDIKGKEYLKTLNKYYISDLGLRNAKMNYRQVEVTHSLENIIYIELIRRGYMVDIGKNNTKEIDFVAKNNKDTYYIQVAYSIVDENKREQEISSFYNLDDGYKKIVITMDNDPFTILKNGYKKVNAIDFLLDENILEKV